MRLANTIVKLAGPRCANVDRVDALRGAAPVTVEIITFPLEPDDRVKAYFPLSRGLNFVYPSWRKRTAARYRRVCMLLGGEESIVERKVNMYRERETEGEREREG